MLIYAEFLLEKMNTCHNNSKKSSATKINKIQVLVIHCLQIVHLIQQKIKLIVIEIQTV